MKFIGPNMAIGHFCEGPALLSSLNIIHYKIFMITLAPQRQFQHPSLAIGRVFFLIFHLIFIFIFIALVLAWKMTTTTVYGGDDSPHSPGGIVYLLKIF